ncbi:MAG TPA: TfoX/Sxy family protein [Thermoanaerobaculia bacterium]|nr:TfoX/Sxy family protein [Thermoanaerobaculia bacterium]
MAFDEKLADRIRALVQDRPDVAERKMFGGLAFLLRGHMCCGIVGSDLMVRVGPGDYESALAESHVRPMDFTGRPLKGMVYVAPSGIRAASSLRRWIERGIRFSQTLPAKPSRA